MGGTRVNEERAAKRSVVPFRGLVFSARRTPRVRFTAHYVQMVLVMLAGMGVLGGAWAIAIVAFGSGVSEFRESAPAFRLLAMGFSMTAPMVWWMRWRGHAIAANRDMALSMILPTLLTVSLLGTGAVTDIGTLLLIQHLVMFPAMLAAMLLRRQEYTH